MRHHRFQRSGAEMLDRVRHKACVLASLLILAFAASQQGIAQCSEKPTVWMSERTAASHLLASRKFVFPTEAPVLAQIQDVIVTVTVDRTGTICKAKASAGPVELRQPAERIVKSFWRYRSFLLDRKPVVVQFPVTVNFVLSVDKRNVKAPEIAGESLQNANPFLRVSSGTAET